jgi:hypothetical protein
MWTSPIIVEAFKHSLTWGCQAMDIDNFGMYMRKWASKDLY